MIRLSRLVLAAGLWAALCPTAARAQSVTVKAVDTSSGVSTDVGDNTNHALRVTVVSGASGGTSIADNAVFTQGSTFATPAAGLYATSWSNPTAGHASVFRIDINGGLYINIDKVGTSAITLGSKTSANSFPVVIASDQGAIPSSQSGIWTIQPGNTANTTPWLFTINQGGNAATVTGANALKVDGSAVTQPVSGTFFQATQPVSIADAADVTLGAKADARSTATDTTAITAISILKEVSFMEQNPASRAVTNAGTFAVQAAQSGNWTARIVGNAGATVDSTVGAGAAPTNAVTVAAIYNSTEISPTTAQAFALQADSKGRLRNVIMDAAGNTRGVNVTAGNALVVDGSAVTQPISGTVTTTPPANASTNVAQLAGTTTDTNSGTKSAGTLRVVLATDQPQLTNKLLVTPDSVALPANQSVNLNQVGGTNIVTAGVAGTQAVGGNVANGVTATENPVPVGGVFTTAPTTLTTGQTATLQFTAAQNAKADLATIAGTAPTTAGKIDVKGADGDVFVRQATAANFNAQVVGNAASGAADGGNPLKTGGVFNTTQPTVTNGQRVDAQYTSRGAAIVAPGVDGFTVTANAGTNLNTSALALDATLGRAQGSTTSGETGPLVQGAVTTNAPSYTTAQTSPLSLDTAGLLRASLKDTPSNTNNLNVNLAASAATVTVTGTVTTTPPANASTNVTQFGSTNVSTGTGAGGAGIPRVTISNDSSLAANQSVNTNQIGGASITTLAAGEQKVGIEGLAASGAAKSGNPVQVGGVFNTAQPTVTTGQAVELQATNRGAAIVATGADTFNVTVNTALPTGSNTIGAVTQASGPWTDNVTQFGGAAVVTGTGTSGAGIPRITTSSDSSLTANQGAAAALTAPWPMKLTDGVTAAAVGTDGSAQVRCVNCQGVTVQASNGLRAPVLGLRLYGSVGQPLGDANPIKVINVTPPDVCLDVTKAGSVAISQTANAQLIAGQPGRRIVVCHYTVVGADAENVSWVEGSGSTCATSTAGVIGGATAANGMNFAANSGVQDGDGATWIAVTAIPGNSLCLFQSGSGRVAGGLKYAFQ